MTSRTILIAIGLFAAFTAGWLGSNRSNEPLKRDAKVTPAFMESAVGIGPPSPATVAPAGTQETRRIAKAQEIGAPDPEASMDPVLLQFQAKLDSEVTQRRLLERRVQELTHRLARLEEIKGDSGPGSIAGLASTSEPEPGQDFEARAEARTARFMSVGFSAEDEKELTRRMDEAEMETLYLRDRARREGWLRTPQYREATAELRNELRNEIGEEAYDRLLYASEQNNRVLINDVLESSPAQEIGLKPGDVLISYDGTRVFSRRDLRVATRQGEPNDRVPLHVERNGQVLELEIPRGPLGVHLGANSVMP